MIRGVEVDVEIVMVELPVSPAARVTLVGLTVTGRVAGETASVKLTVPEKLLTLVMLSVDVAEKPAVSVILLAFTDITKSGVVLVENIAV